MTTKVFRQSVFLLLSISLLVVIYGCAGKRQYSKLKNYYEENTSLHTETADSLMAFCQTNHTDVMLRKSDLNESAISFHIHFARESAYYPVFYDLALNRHDLYPEKTAGFSIPSTIIKNFSQSIYKAASADSSLVFFGDEWHVKFQLGTQGDAQYGILVSADTAIARKCAIRLSPNACVTEGTTP